MVLPCHFQGSLKIYKIPLPPDIEDTTITGGDPQYGLFQGLPNNDPLHVLCRIYVVKVGKIISDTVMENMQETKMKS